MQPNSNLELDDLGAVDLCYDFSIGCIRDWLDSGGPPAALGVVWIMLSKAMLMADSDAGAIARMFRDLADEIEEPRADATSKVPLVLS